jgi:DNA polymerase-1
MTKKKLLLADELNIMYKYHHILMNRPLFTGDLNTSTIFGLLEQVTRVSMLLDIDHVIICGDHDSDSFRKDHYPEYKAGRDAQPAEITEALKHIPQVFETLDIPVVRVEKLEADDIIGTYAIWAQELGMEVYILSGDKDFAQILEKDIYQITKPDKGSTDTFAIWDTDKVQEVYGIRRPEQFIDILALMGDTSDGYAGAPGIGLKTACKWISHYVDLENLYDNLHQLTPKKQQLLEEHEESVLMSQWLATIFTTGRDYVPDLTEILCEGNIDPEKAVPMLAQYRMFSIMDSIGLKYEKAEAV